MTVPTSDAFEDNYIMHQFVRYLSLYSRSWSLQIWSALGMVTIVKLYILLGLILRITRSKSNSHALYKTGVHGTSFNCIPRHFSQFSIFRCTALSTDLDGEADRRSHEHTEHLMEAFDNTTLWDQWGVVSGIMVHLFILQKQGSKLKLCTALHILLSSGGHSRAPLTGSTSSSYQGDFQGSPGHLGRRVD